MAPRLASDPTNTSDAAIKKLAGWRDFWRYRSGDYRFIYRVDRDNNQVVFLMLGHRSDIYGRLGQTGNGVALRIIANPDLADYLEAAPTPTERVRAQTNAWAESGPNQAEGFPDALLPKELSPDFLTSIGVPRIYHQNLWTVRTEGELLEAPSRGLPTDIANLILEGLYPPSIDDLVREPLRIEPEPGAAASVLESGDQTLESFLLVLDKEQKPFVERFRGTPAPEGPWLLKGGPGSGKSTIALYCLSELYHQRMAGLPFTGATQRPKILFTTYTKSLVGASRYLLESLGIASRDVDIVNFDSLVGQLLPSSLNRMRKPVSNSDEVYLKLARNSLENCRSNYKHFSFDKHQLKFLSEEIDWVVLGQNCQDFSSYASAPKGPRWAHWEESKA